MVTSKGQFRTMAGAPMAPPNETRRRQRLEAGARSPLGRMGREPYGARLTRGWTPQQGLGLPRPNDAGFTPLGAHLDEDASLRAEGVALAAGGRSVGERVAAGVAVEPIGARPSVPARLGVSFASIGKLPGVAPDPYGLQPLELSEAQVYGTGASPFDNSDAAWTGAAAAATALRLVEPYTQYVPPPPASQNVCLINGFDPRWGQPPQTWRGVVMRFDPGMGAYRFDPNSPTVRNAFERAADARLMDWYEEVSSRYRQGYMLQPYRPSDGTGSWTYRWIPRRQEVVCV